MLSLFALPFGGKKIVRGRFYFGCRRCTTLTRLSSTSHRLIQRTRQTATGTGTPCSGFQIKTTTQLHDKGVLCKDGFRDRICPTKLYTRQALVFCTRTGCTSSPVRALTVTSSPSRHRYCPYNRYHRIVISIRHHRNTPVQIIVDNNNATATISSTTQLLPFAFIL